MVTAQIDRLAPGMQVRIREEDWLITGVDRDRLGGTAAVHVTGTSELVRGMEAAFLTDLDDIQVVDPAATQLVVDTSPMHRDARLHIEAAARRTPVGAGDPALRTPGRTLVDDLPYQMSPVHKALAMPRPRILIADAVGLGKTIEVAQLLNELSLRGAADRVLAVVPASILEQVQHELWCRTGFPLVRLDTAGIQRMRQRIPAGRNPFAFFRRVIVSIDTLKQPGRYLPLLRDVEWDVVWIDECHSLINRRSQNNQLAQVLASRSDGFVLTSATPHNGNQESFAELIGLLDPTAIADKADYEAADIAHLFVRRHRHSEEVKAAVGDRWAEREDPQVVSRNATPAEDAIFTELATTWTSPTSGRAPCADSLFPWTLFKAALSSPVALATSIEQRLKRRAANDSFAAGEGDALTRLAELTETAVATKQSSKLTALTAELEALGVTPGGDGRAVIFSERIPTLKWLRDRLADAGWRDDEMVVFHAQMPEADRQAAVKAFGMKEAPVRLLITGDIASEGVNLHQQCHVLIHWDLPWSLIRIQQRNGRIDRYGQEHPPVIRALATIPSHPEALGDGKIISRLLTKEHRAHTSLGEAAAIMMEWDGEAEEAKITRLLRDNATSAERDAAIDAAVQTAGDVDDWAWEGGVGQLLAAGDQPTVQTPPTTAPPRLMDNVDFLREVAALQDEDFGWADDGQLLSFTPPADLTRRLADLPTELVRGLDLASRVKVTGDPVLANTELQAAKDRQADGDDADSKAAMAWPEIGYLTDEHPVTAWAVDRAMTRFGRGTAPIIVTPGLDAPAVLCTATWSNTQGEPLAVAWAAIQRESGMNVLACPPAETFDWLRHHGVADGIPTTATPDVDVDTLTSLVGPAVTVATNLIEGHAEDVLADIDADLQATRKRLVDWEHRVRALADTEASAEKRKTMLRHADDVHASTESLLANLQPSDAPTIAVIAVLTPPKG